MLESSNSVCLACIRSVKPYSGDVIVKYTSGPYAKPSIRNEQNRN